MEGSLRSSGVSTGAPFTGVVGVREIRTAGG